MHKGNQDSHTPRIYRPSITWSLLLGSLSVLVGGFGGWAAWYFGSGHEYRNRSGQLLLVGTGLAFLFLSVYMVATLMKSRLLLADDGVEDRGVFSSRSVRTIDIKGWRLISTRNAPSSLVLETKDGSKPLKISQIFQLDDVFHRWLGSFPNLDADDYQSSLKELMSDQEGRHSPEDRGLAVARWRRLTRVFNGISTAVAIWGIAFPQPYGLVIACLCAMPLVAIWMAASSNNIVRLDENRNDPHPNVAVGLLLPGGILLLRGLSDLHTESWAGLLWYALLVALIFCFLALKADEKLTKKFLRVFLIFLFSFLYGLGATIEANALLDRSGATVYTAEVLNKHISRGRSTTYRLTLSEWGTAHPPGTIDVNRSLYESVEVGERVCIDSRRGLLKLPWYTVRRCN